MRSRRFIFRQPLYVTLLLTFGMMMPGAARAVWEVGTPITMYWTGPDLSPAVAQQAVDGGFNVVWVRNPLQLARAQQYGLRAIYEERTGLLVPASLDDPQKKTQMDNLIDYLKTFPALYSIYVDDEPSAAEFADLGRLVDYLHQRAPNVAPYINLHPYGVANESLGTTGDPVTAYNAYLNQYKSVVQPSLLSYDRYQLLKTANGDNIDGGLYLYSLEMISQSAHQSGLPFVNIVQGMVYEDSWRLPTTSELRFLNYSTLAYGAQGICYFAYVNLGPDKGGIEPNADGTQTSVYTAAASLNPEFIAVAGQYQSLEWIGTYLKGYQASAMPPGTTQLPGNSPFNISALTNTMLYVGGDPLKGALFGLFDKDGTTVGDATFALIANLDYSASKTYQITGPGNLSVFDPATGAWAAMGSNTITLDLLPGGGKLVGLTSLLLAGDYDRNGTVGPEDYNLWYSSFGSMTNLSADGNGNNFIDAADYVVWRKHFDATSGSGAASVPEPASLILLSIACGAMALSLRSYAALSSGTLIKS